MRCDDVLPENHLEANNEAKHDCPRVPGSICTAAKMPDENGYIIGETTVEFECIGGEWTRRKFTDFRCADQATFSF